MSRYTLSPRGFKEEVLPWDYGPGAETRKVYAPGLMSYGGREYKLGKAFEGKRVGIRPLSEDGLLGVYFCQMKVHEINLHEEQTSCSLSRGRGHDFALLGTSD